METISHRIYVLPGPELEKLISDQADKLRAACPQAARLNVTLWAEEANGLREKYCGVSVHLDDDELRVTRHGSTHILAVREAMRTVRNRIARIGARIKEET